MFPSVRTNEDDCHCLSVCQVKSQQTEVMRILDSKSIKYELIDISVSSELRNEMRSKSGIPSAVPPQLFNGEDYCGVRSQLPLNSPVPFAPDATVWTETPRCHNQKEDAHLLILLVCLIWAPTSLHRIMKCFLQRWRTIQWTCFWRWPEESSECLHHNHTSVCHYPAGSVQSRPTPRCTMPNNRKLPQQPPSTLYQSES